jgi:alkylation response protein AidB-like acyl-CoA dehydrogenase
VAETGQLARGGVLGYGTEEQKLTWLPRLASGEMVGAIGMHGQDTCELFFDDVRVPRSNLLGDSEGEGFIQLMQQLPQERLVIAVAAAAVIEKAVGLAVEYSKDRGAFGRSIFDFQNSRFVLAECDTISTVAWAFLDDCIAKHMRGELDIAGAAKAKLWLTDQQCEVSTAVCSSSADTGTCASIRSLSSLSTRGSRRSTAARTRS